MKYAIIVADGMADRPLDILGGLTPMEKAHKPYMDLLASKGQCGMARTVPEGYAPGSDTANLSLAGYDPAVYLTGRAPLEAAGIGVPLEPTDLAFRCNLVCLSEGEVFEERIMEDYSGGEIDSALAFELIDSLQSLLTPDKTALHPGVSYRHCLVVHHEDDPGDTTPPHDILTRPIKEYLPKGAQGQRLLSLMKASAELLRDHPVNAKLRSMGKPPITCCWFWGGGKTCTLPPFEETYGIRGGVISAVDLLHGIAACAGMEHPRVPGVTGLINTNYQGKLDAAIDLFRSGHDLVYIHMEAPDESGHHSDPFEKTEAIELIDEKIVGPLYEHLKASGEPFAILIAPDHPTPISIRTHSDDPVPYLIYRSQSETAGPARFTEALTEAFDPTVVPGYTLMGKLTDAVIPSAVEESH